MIQLIGIMVAMYIITRMIETVTTKNLHWLVSMFSVITLLVTILCFIGLFTTGQNIQ